MTKLSNKELIRLGEFVNSDPILKKELDTKGFVSLKQIKQRINEILEIPPVNIGLYDNTPPEGTRKIT